MFPETPNLTSFIFDVISFAFGKLWFIAIPILVGLLADEIHRHNLRDYATLRTPTNGPTS